METTQRTFQFTPGPETKAERCWRLLARLGDRRIKTAGVFFNERAHHEATQRAQALNRKQSP